MDKAKITIAAPVIGIYVQLTKGRYIVNTKAIF